MTPELCVLHGGYRTHGSGFRVQGSVADGERSPYRFQIIRAFICR
jgi:hypothetical protein